MGLWERCQVIFKWSNFKSSVKRMAVSKPHPTKDWTKPQPSELNPIWVTPCVFHCLDWALKHNIHGHSSPQRPHLTDPNLTPNLVLYELRFDWRTSGQIFRYVSWYVFLNMQFSVRNVQKTCQFLLYDHLNFSHNSGLWPTISLLRGQWHKTHITQRKQTLIEVFCLF